MIVRLTGNLVRTCQTASVCVFVTLYIQSKLGSSLSIGTMEHCYERRTATRHILNL